MKEAINVPMAVDACGVDGRAEGLKSMMQRLEMCQKSLNEYLDMKKKVVVGDCLQACQSTLLEFRRGFCLEHGEGRLDVRKAEAVVT